jgi:hypothetical protein
MSINPYTADFEGGYKYDCLMQYIYGCTEILAQALS